ncbi:Galactose oxidase [Fusarium floridanum]|uniref:Galactose oxidase n=1 Tax=Fusarium floridanum TaxID=1325733 RepID=A0A428SB53_9HYPO|nr:Galactose oxidase [Fusarium floridanum]
MWSPILTLCLAGIFWDEAMAIVIPAQNSTKVKVQMEHLSLRATGPLGTAINRNNWKVTCDSDNPDSDNACQKAIDGDVNSFWHTAWFEDTSKDPGLPHTLTVDMKTVQNVNGISALPRQDGTTHGWIARHDIFLSTDGKTWGSPVATGTWYADGTEKFSNFETKRARYVRIVATTEAYDGPWTSIAEFNVYKAATYTAPKTGIGMWGPTLDFPIVPVAGAVDPGTGKVLVWSSYYHDTMNGSPGGMTLTSLWDPETGIITQREVFETNHDMFCPGISMDGTGQIVVTGGNNAARTSTWDPVKNQWVSAPDMKIPRGYQSSATTSNGKVFTIGGSWGGDRAFKPGEIFDPSSRKWTLLSNAKVEPMLTADAQGIFRSDNHAWLFGWKGETIFQAGPSSAMNWYYTQGKGTVKPAGKRQSSRGVDPDSMCGNAVMFDAVKGKIVTFGGTPNYQDSYATTNAHIITIGAPGTQASVAFASNGMYYPRVFHTSVLLPDGTVFITGGQEYAIPFEDSTPQLTPEMYIPDSDTFIKQQPNSIVRTYHSMSILLPDARVFNGGGGLCGDCSTNHFDAQIFTPSYLLTKDGKPATRPKIVSVSATTIKVGGSITVTTGGVVNTASLIRYGTATHTVNTDQRRIPLTLTGAGKNKYTFKVPGDSGIALPGYWMLFVMNSAGVPSVASTIKVTT